MRAAPLPTAGDRPARSKGTGDAARACRRLAALGVWAFGCFSYWAVEVTAVLISSKSTFWVAARWALFGVLPDCLLAPFALWFTRRVPWGRVPPWRFLLRHAAGGGLFVALSSV